MATLNTATSSSGWNDNFAYDKSLKSSIWQVKWGNSKDFTFNNGALTIKSTAAEHWSSIGFMQADFGRTYGEGYGLYSVTASLNAHEGKGACVDLWPSNNKWPGAELDMLETWGSNRGTGFATIHWAGSSGGNGYASHQFTLDLTKKNTFAMDWERGKITYYINGKLFFQTTSHVPLDAADGGYNEVMGAQVTNAGNSPVSSAVSLNIYDMSYSKSHAASVPAATTAAVQNDTASASTVSALAAPAAAIKPSFISSSHSTIKLAAGQTLTDNGSANHLTFSSSGGVTLSHSVLTNGDTFDLRSVMSKTNWDGKSADLGHYLTSKSVDSGKDLQILVHPSGGAASSVLATLLGAGKDAAALANFEHHALLK